jgi:hypothetical protein
MRKDQKRRSNAARTRRYVAPIAAAGTAIAAAFSFASGASAITTTTPTTPAVSSAAYGAGRLMAADPSGGYWTVTSLGAVTPYGGAPSLGSPALSGVRLAQPIVGMAATPDGAGYWLVASDGGIFTFGDAKFYGSTGGGSATALGLIISPPTAGYSVVASNGTASVFSSSTAAASGAVTATGAGAPIATPNVSQGGDCQPASTTPTAAADAPLTSLIANQSGPGWVGGDATYSTALPNGKEAFVFSDTLVGTAQASGAASVSAIVHSSELVGNTTSLQGDFGGTASTPQTLIPDTTDAGDQWQVAATYVENGSQLVFVDEFAPVAGSDFDSFTGHAGIAVMSIPADGIPTYSSVTAVPDDANTQWGKAVLQSGGYNYVYGSDISSAANAFEGMKVARVPQGESLDTNDWTYWNGGQWVSGEANAVPDETVTVLTGVAPQPSGNGYMAVSIPGWAGGDTSVDLSYACSPAGPWSAPAPVYTIPQVTQYANELAYIPTFHPELSGAGGMVISYNIDNTGDLAALEQDVHEYQPQFIALNPGF